MPVVSEEQRRAAAAALAVKQGKGKAEDLRGAARKMYESMTEEQLRDFATKVR